MLSLRPSGKQLLGVTAIAGVVALLVLITATAALAGVWLPGQQATEVAAPHEMDQMYRPSFRTIPAMTLPAPPKPKPKPVAAPAPSAPSGDIWDCIAAKESGNQPLPCAPHCGRLQWLPSTWRMAGGTRYADLPQNATYAQEVEIARAWLAKTSWASQWPNTSRMCGAR